jgi:hypothetical protein
MADTAMAAGSGKSWYAGMPAAQAVGIARVNRIPRTGSGLECPK